MALRSSRDEIGLVLEAVGADRDANGRFFLSWSQGRRGLKDSPRAAGRRIVIDDDVLFKIRGRWVPLEGAIRRNQPRTLPLWPEMEPLWPEMEESNSEEPISSGDC
ncbi:MAG: hypothetical protein K8J08_18095 [Thermoanaerobaculia bacterium]|nr:hypothetical protein [Thermoanaerobaculia bacterium]